MKETRLIGDLTCVCERERKEERKREPLKTTEGGRGEKSFFFLRYLRKSKSEREKDRKRRRGRGGWIRGSLQEISPGTARWNPLSLSLSLSLSLCLLSSFRQGKYRPSSSSSSPSRTQEGEKEEIAGKAPHHPPSPPPPSPPPPSRTDGRRDPI